MIALELTSRFPGSPALATWLGIGLDALAVYVQRFLDLVRVVDGNSCWEWTGCRQKRTNGTLSYGTFCIGNRRFLAHRFAWMIEHGPAGARQVVRHDCDNVACVRGSHLLIGTQADNMHDMWNRGRGVVSHPFPAGTAHPNSKMNPDRVRALRKMAEGGATCRQLGREFGLNHTTAHDIATRKTWKEVA